MLAIKSCLATKTTFLIISQKTTKPVALCELFESFPHRALQLHTYYNTKKEKGAYCMLPSIKGSPAFLRISRSLIISQKSRLAVENSFFAMVSISYLLIISKKGSSRSHFFILLQLSFPQFLVTRLYLKWKLGPSC